MELSDTDFTMLRDLIAQETGIRLSEFKKAFLIARLSPRLPEVGAATFREYLRILQDPLRQQEEMGHLINRITTNETRFFRENQHFEYLQKYFLPHWLATKESSRSLHVWCAGCASGEEAFSLAMILNEVLEKDPTLDWRILATDIDSQVLTRARAGLFPEKSSQQIPPEFLKKYFLKGVGDRQGWIKVRSLLQRRISFEYCNLHRPMRLPLEPFDLIFCRNVLIYFLPEARERVLVLFHRLLNPKGLLFLGHSEILFDREDLFRHMGRTIYQKADHPERGE